MQALRTALAGPAGIPAAGAAPSLVHEPTPPPEEARGSDRLEQALHIGVGLIVLAVMVIAVILMIGWIGPGPAPTASPEPTPAPADVPSLVPTRTPAFTQPPVPTTGPASTADPRVLAQQVVQRFQQLRADAHRTGDTSQYATVLAGDTLTASIEAVNQYQRQGCHVDIVDTLPMTTTVESASANRVLVIGYRTETRTLVCPDYTRYYCERYQGYYTVEQMANGWYITNKDTRNLVALTPCP